MIDPWRLLTLFLGVVTIAVSTYTIIRVRRHPEMTVPLLVNVFACVSLAEGIVVVALYS